MEKHGNLKRLDLPESPHAEKIKQTSPNVGNPRTRQMLFFFFLFPNLYGLKCPTFAHEGKLIVQLFLFIHTIHISEIKLPKVHSLSTDLHFLMV